MPLDLKPVLAAFPGRPVVWLELTESTMVDASRLEREGCATGAVVGTEEQTAGQGRYGRQWHSERETGLYFTVVLRPRAAPFDLPAIALALAMAVADAIRDETGLVCDLRWPNDVLLNERKCAGILVQLQEGAVLAGIGINVNQDGFPDDIAKLATSLSLAAARKVSRESLLVGVLSGIDYYVSKLEQQGRSSIIRDFTAYSSFARGRAVEVDMGGAMLRGVTEGLDESGFLVVRGNDGARTVILAGGVRPVAE
jgi:BirA family biotin operon repressor/biotin-[acetyl-CoA-carboxylase] ligase